MKSRKNRKARAQPWCGPTKHMAEARLPRRLGAPRPTEQTTRAERPLLTVSPTHCNETSTASANSQSDTSASASSAVEVTGLATAPAVSVRVADIVVNDHCRIPTEDGVTQIRESTRLLGQQVPITVQYNAANRPVLVAGVHRLEAAKALKWETISCVALNGSETDARLWTISENLHRTELTYLERSQLVAEWVHLVLNREFEAGQFVPPIGGRQPHDLGIARAARWLPVKGANFEARRKSIERLFKISTISPWAKKAALESGLGNHQTALLEVARQGTEAEQIARVQTKAKLLREGPRKRSGVAANSQPDASSKPASSTTATEPSHYDDGNEYPELPALLDRRGALTKADNDPAFVALQSAWMVR
jgi:ParB-like nuclease domain